MKGGPLSKSRWVVGVIALAYKTFTCHSTRAFSSLWATFRGVSLVDVCCPLLVHLWGSTTSMLLLQDVILAVPVILFFLLVSYFPRDFAGKGHPLIKHHLWRSGGMKQKADWRIQNSQNHAYICNQCFVHIKFKRGCAVVKGSRERPGYCQTACSPLPSFIRWHKSDQVLQESRGKADLYSGDLFLFAAWDLDA